MSKTRARKRLPSLILFLTIFIIVILFSLREITKRDLVRKFVVKRMEEVFQREVEIVKVKLKILPEFAIAGERVLIKEDGEGKLISAREIFLSIDLLSLLKGRLSFKELDLIEPTIYLTMAKDGKIDVFSSIEGKGLKATAFLIKRMSIRNGTIYFRDDREETDQSIDIRFRDTNLFLEVHPSDRSMDFNLFTEMVYEKRASKIEIEGMITSADEEVDISTLSFALEGQFDTFDSTLFKPYIKDTINMDILQGDIKGNFLFKGNPTTDFSLSGLLESSGFEAILPSYYTKPLAFDKASLSYNVIYQDGIVDIKGFKLILGDRTFEGGLKLPFISFDTGKIKGYVKSSWFPILWLNQYLPESTILSSLLGNVTAGKARIKEAVFKGSLEELLNPLLYEERKPIAIDMAFQDLVLRQSSRLSGELIIKGDRLNLREVKGIYANISVSKLDGEITEIFSPNPKIDLSINSSLNLEGFNSVLSDAPFPTIWRERFVPFTDWKGRVGVGLSIKMIYGAEEKPHIKGSLSFQDVGFSYSGITQPFTGIQGEAVIRDNNIEAIKAEGVLGNVSVKIVGAILDYNSEAPNIKIGGNLHGSGQDLRNILFPSFFKDAVIRGMVSGGFFTSGRLSDLTLETSFDMTSLGYGFEEGIFKPEGLKNSLDIKGRYKKEGRFSVSSAQYKLNGEEIELKGEIKEMDKMVGYIKVIADDIQLSSIKEIFPPSVISNIDGNIKGNIIFKGSFIEGDIETEGEIRFIKLGFAPSPPSPPVKDLTITINFDKDSINIPYLFIHRGESIIKAKGVLKDIKHPKIIFSLSSPNFDKNDFPPGWLVKTLIRRFSDNISIEGDLEIVKGKWYSTEFSSLKAGLSFKDDSWVISPLELSMEGGLVKEGKWERISIGQESFNKLRFRIVNADIEKVIKRWLKRDRIMTGIFDAKVDLTWEGGGGVLETLKGTINTKFKDGRVFKLFEVLPKLLTILNPLRIITLDLKEFEDQGMIYKDVTGDFVIDNKLLTTNNLVINGKEMRIVWIGKIDLSKVEIDSLMAVQPFETVDELIGETIGRIPLLGEIIVGKDRKLLVLYYKVKGDLEHPKIQDINLEEMSKGIINRLNIIPRMMEGSKPPQP